MRTRVFLLLAVAWAAGVAQESRPAGLLPAESPLAPIQQALLRGDSSEARAAIDYLIGTASDDVLRALGPEIALLRAATEPVPARAAAMLAVASTYPDRPVAEVAVVAGLAALISDGPEIGDLAAPLIGRVGSAESPGDDGRSRGAAPGPSRELVQNALVEILAARAEAEGRDQNAIDHARRLIGQFPSPVSDWICVRPAEPITFPARIDTELRLRFYEIPSEKVLPDPSHLMLPPGRPKIDLVLPALRDGLVLPALTPGAWLVVATSSNPPYRRAWPVIVSDLELVGHSVPGSAKAMAIAGGKPVPDPALTTFFDSRIASRTRGAQPSGPDNAMLARVGSNLAIAPIATPPLQPPIEKPEQRLAVDLMTDRPVYRPGDDVRMRLVGRMVGRTTPDPDGPIALVPAIDAPIRVILWPRQPHEVVLEGRISNVLALAVKLPSSAPPGPVRVHVVDIDQKPTAGVLPDPVLDAVAFSVQLEPTEPLKALVTAPASWKPGDPRPEVRILGMFRDGAPAAGLTAVVSIAAGSFREEVALVLDDRGAATATIGLDAIPETALGRTAHLDVSARLLAGDRELAKTDRRIEIARAKQAETPPLSLSVLTKKPLAGEELKVAITGPPGEPVLLTVATRTSLVPRVAVLGSDGRAEVGVPTEAGWWPAIELLCSTRQVREPNRRLPIPRGRERGRLEKTLTVPLGRPGAPEIAIKTAPGPLLGSHEASVELTVTPRGPAAQTVVSVSVIDDALLRFASAGPIDPEAALRPQVELLAPRASASPSTSSAADWYASVLGRNELGTWTPDPRMPPPATGRQVPRLPSAAAQADVGGWPIALATAHFEANVAMDERGSGVVKFRVPDRTTSWRITAVAIDGDGRSSVATAVVESVGSGAAATKPPAEQATWLTTRRVFIEKPDPLGIAQTVSPPDLPAGTATVFRSSDTIPDALVVPIAENGFALADHIAARIIAHAWFDVRSGNGRVPPPLESDLALLRALKTPDGYAWHAGDPTDFELTPFVLHAISVLADAHVDPSLFGVLPEARDGFLRFAPRALGEAQGNPQAALEIEDIRDHGIFRRSVPPERQAIVLTETVIGMLAVDPGLIVAKNALASLVRQSADFPSGLIARAGRALLRAGDRESAAIALQRLDSPSQAVGTSAMESEIAQRALRLDLARLLDVAAPERDSAALELAKSCSREAWPELIEAAFGLSALRAHYGVPSDVPPKVVIDDLPSLAPVLCIVQHVVDVEKTPVAPSQARAPARRVFRDGDDPSAAPDASGVAFSSGTFVRLEIKAEPAAGRPCAVVCPIPRGARVLSASDPVTGQKAAVGKDEIVWLLRSPSAQARVEASLITTHPVRSAWAPCKLIALDTNEVLGWSGSTRFAVTDDVAAKHAESGIATLLGPDALPRARAELVNAIETAPDRAAMAKAVKDVLELPDPALPDAILALLPKIAPVLDTADAIAPVLHALGERRSELWTPANVEILTGGARVRLNALTEASRDYPEAQRLVARWAADPAAPRASVESQLAALMALARLRGSEPADVPDLWDPSVILRLLLPDAGEHAITDGLDRVGAARDLPFQRNFSLMGAQPGPANESRWGGWRKVLDHLETLIAGPEAVPGLLEHLQLVAAVTDPPPPAFGFFTAAEAAFATRRDELRRSAAEHAVTLIEARALPVESAAGMPLVSAMLPGMDLAPRLLRILEAEIAAGRGDTAVPIGTRILERRHDQYGFDDPLGPRLAAIATTGPRPWRLPAMLALTLPERRRVPSIAIEQLLRDPETTSAAVDIVLEREDAADLRRIALAKPLPRYEARRLLEKLVLLEARPFERVPIGELLSLAARLDAETAAAVDAEIARRADENPAELATALATARDDRLRQLLAKELARVRHADIPWEPADPGLDRIRTRLLALTGDPDAARAIRASMTAAMQASQTQGASESVIHELWPYLAPSTTPDDVLTFGAPSSIEALAARAASWTDEEIREFFRSPAAQPEPGATVTRFGSVAMVAKLIGQERAGRFSEDLVALWRAYVDAGLAFDALSLFGQMGGGQVTVLTEVLQEPGSAASPRRFDEAQKLAYVAALRRDLDTYRELEALMRRSSAGEVARALARYELEVTGYWKEPAGTSTKPSIPIGPRTPQDWQRVLMTRLKNDGLGAIERAEPPVLQAWLKTLRERGLLVN